MADYEPHRRKSLLPFLAAIFWLCFGSFTLGQDTQKVSRPEPPNTLPSAQALKSCIERRDGAKCLDELFREALKSHSAVEALHWIQRFSDDDADIRRDCHPIVHAIGRETFRIKETIHDSFSACDQTCRDDDRPRIAHVVPPYEDVWMVGGAGIEPATSAL